MSEETLEVKMRSTRGTRNARRLRKAGEVPAVLYGHGEGTVKLSCSSEDLAAVIRHGTRVVALTGDVQQTALINDVHWDTFGAEVLHVDFTRVSATELVVTTIAIETRGEAPGIKEGGIVEQPIHEVEIELPAAKVTDHFELNINKLHLNDTLTAADLDLPEGATLITPLETVLVQCVEPVIIDEELEEGAEAAGAAEPEVIGEKDDEDEES